MDILFGNHKYEKCYNLRGTQEEMVQIFDHSSITTFVLAKMKSINQMYNNHVMVNSGKIFGKYILCL